jgi:type IV secretion system protein TrbJ
MTRNLSIKERAAIGALALTATGLAITSMIAPPVQAQWTVFDPTNYVQNLLIAARTLQQINNQIRMLQNQAQSLLNQKRNLATISFPELTQVNQTLQKIDRLMGQAQTIQFRVSGLNQQFLSLYPTSFNAALTNNSHVIDARNRMAASMTAYQQTMTVQSQIVENIQADEATLAGIVARSQSAVGAVQVGQATNQLLALIAKEEMQLQNLLAAQSRANTYQQASRVQAQTDAQGATTKFLGSGTAYTPQ